MLSCLICLNKMTALVESTCCKQKLCQSCLDKVLKYSCYCVMCKVALKPVRGNQLCSGIISHSFTKQSIPGYENMSVLLRILS